MIQPQLSNAQLITLAAYHVNHYERMEGQRNVREDERQHYLGIWRSIQGKVENGGDLAPFEQSEIMDAVWSGDFDRMLGLASLTEGKDGDR